jgi:cytochrome c553
MKLMSLGVVPGLIAALALSSSLYAAGDVEAGAEKVAVCASCHGPNGVSVSPEYPSLAGQVPGYIATQLKAYKTGERDNAVMVGMVAPLTEEDFVDIDAFYASLAPPVRAIGEDQVEAARRGERVYRGGYRPFSVAACMSCHGPGGHGIPPHYPRLSGQQAEYLEAQLLAFKSGERQNDVMNPIAFKLSETQIRELALYMSALN